MEKPGLLGLWTRRNAQMQVKQSVSSPFAGAEESEAAARLVQDYKVAINQKFSATQLHDFEEAHAPQLRVG